MKKSDINKILKENGLTFVKLSTGDWIKPEKCFINGEGKRVKGIPASTFGPTTVTTAYKEIMYKRKQKVESDLVDFGMKKDGDKLVSPDGKLKLTLNETVFPQYARSAGYDDGYKSIYLVPVYHK